MKLVKTISISILALVLCVSCSGAGDRKTNMQTFSEIYDENAIYIGVSVPFKKINPLCDFSKGIELGVEEINNNGGIDGKKVILVPEDDEGIVTTAMQIAQKFVEDKRISAVIGHWSSSVSIACSDIYERGKLPMISPASSSKALIKPNNSYIFRNIISDDTVGKELSTYAKEQGYKNIAIFYSDDDYGRTLANSFEDFTTSNRCNIIERRAYPGSREDFLRCVRKLSAMDCDAVFLADLIQPSGYADTYVKVLAENGIRPAFFGADGIDSPEMIKNLGSLAEGIVVATMFNQNSSDPGIQSYSKNFRTKYNKEPDSWSVQGYETLKILIEAIRTVKSNNPVEIAKALRETRDYQGLTGKISFTKDGEVLGKNIFLKKVRNGKFEYLK